MESNARTQAANAVRAAGALRDARAEITADAVPRMLLKGVCLIALATMLLVHAEQNVNAAKRVCVGLIPSRRHRSYALRAQVCGI